MGDDAAQAVQDPPQGGADGGDDQDTRTGAGDGDELAGAGAGGAAEGGADGDGEGGDGDVDAAAVIAQLREAGVGRELIRAYLEASDDEERAEILGPHLASAEERGRQRAQEAKEARESRQTHYQQVSGVAGAAGKRVYAALLKEYGDDDGEGNQRLNAVGQRLWDDIRRYRIGAMADAGIAQEEELTAVRTATDPFLGELTPQQKKRLEEAEYKQATTGGLHEVVARLTLTIEQLQKAPSGDGKKNGNGGLTPEAVEQLKKALPKMAKLGPAPPKGKGSSVAGERERIQKEIRDLDPLDPKRDEKMDALKKRIDALPKE